MILELAILALAAASDEGGVTDSVVERFRAINALRESYEIPPLTNGEMLGILLEEPISSISSRYAVGCVSVQRGVRPYRIAVVEIEDMSPLGFPRYKLKFYLTSPAYGSIPNTLLYRLADDLHIHCECGPFVEIKK